MLLLLYGHHVGAPPGLKAPTWHLHAKLYKFRWNTFLNNAQLKSHIDQDFGRIEYTVSWTVHKLPREMSSLSQVAYGSWSHENLDPIGLNVCLV